jgi:hypothetical protein
MFTPTQQDVRRFFCETYRKFHAKEILSPLEAIASDWIQQHSEYNEVLSDLDNALHANYSMEQGNSNPFLHLSMHLSIAEQIAVDQPRGVRTAFETLASKLNSQHEAHHEIMECLGTMIWNSQRSGLPPDGEAYIETLRKRASS